MEETYHDPGQFVTVNFSIFVGARLPACEKYCGSNRAPSGSHALRSNHIPADPL